MQEVFFGGFWEAMEVIFIFFGLGTVRKTHSWKKHTKGWLEFFLETSFRYNTIRRSTGFTRTSWRLPWLLLDVYYLYIYIVYSQSAKRITNFGCSQTCWDIFVGPLENNWSGQIIATSHDLTPNGGLGRVILLFQGNLGWWNIIIWPDWCGWFLPGRWCFFLGFS